MDTAAGGRGSRTPAIVSLGAREAETLEPTGLPVVMYQSWRHLLFLHWAVAPGEIGPMLPKGLHVDTHDGQAYVGVVPFEMCGVRPRWLPTVRGLSDFPELNLRTYVVSDDGRPGVWFFSLDAANAVAVRIARSLFYLPYRHAAMRSRVWRDTHAGLTTIDYSSIRFTNDSRRKLDWQTRSWFRYRVPDAESRFAEPGTLDYFLTERYLLYSWKARGSVLYSGRVWHSPYPLHIPEDIRFRTSLFEINGMAARDTPPVHCLYSPGVDVKVYPLQKHRFQRSGRNE